MEELELCCWPCNIVSVVNCCIIVLYYVDYKILICLICSLVRNFVSSVDSRVKSFVHCIAWYHDLKMNGKRIIFSPVFLTLAFRNCFLCLTIIGYLFYSLKLHILIEMHIYLFWALWLFVFKTLFRILLWISSDGLCVMIFLLLSFIIYHLLRNNDVCSLLAWQFLGLHSLRALFNAIKF